MPPMTLLGWFHTVMGVIAILTAAYTCITIASSERRQVGSCISSDHAFGSRLGAAIYNQGGFGVGHILAVLTLTALFADTGDAGAVWQVVCICRRGPTQQRCCFT